MSRAGMMGMVLACGILVTCASAQAQEPNRRFGLTVGYPGSGGVIGLVWQGNRTALRPELSFSSRFAGENTTGDSSQVGVTVTVLRYLARKDGVSAYVGPRLSYGRSSSSGPSNQSTITSNYGVGAAIGLQYELTRRIGVYGEVGAGYTYARTSATTTVLPGTFSASSHVLGSRGALGLNLYF